MSSDVPYSFGQARDVVNQAKAAQKAAEDNVREAFRQFGMARRAYQTELAQKILELRAEGMAATLCPDLARGDRRVADLRFKRDVAEGVKEAATSAIWRMTADRRELEQLISWSLRRELAENGGGAQPQWSEMAPDGTYGGARS